MVKSYAARLDAVFHALSDSTRRAILRDIAAKEKTVGEVARPYAISLAAVSHYFRVLRESGVVSTRKDGKTLMNTLRREDLDARSPGLLDAVLWDGRIMRCRTGRR